MAKYAIEAESLTAIADAVREKKSDRSHVVL